MNDMTPIAPEVSGPAGTEQLRLDAALRSDVQALPVTCSKTGESPRARLEPLRPKFVSVTYGAGGSTRERTARTVKRILTDTGIPAAAHLTCVGASRDEVNAVIREYDALGIKRFVALRGDPASREIFHEMAPAGDEDWDTEYLDLVMAVRVVPDLDTRLRRIHVNVVPEGPGVTVRLVAAFVSMTKIVAKP